MEVDVENNEAKIKLYYNKLEEIKKKKKIYKLEILLIEYVEAT
jgi:hypothetical protein